MANPKLNKKVKSFLDSYLKDTPKNSPEHQHAIMLILRGALTDANFHSEARQLDKMFPTAKKSKYVGTDMETVIEDKGIDIAKAAKWDGYEIIDAFVAYTNNTKLDSLKEGFYSEYVSEFLNEVAMGEDENDPEEIKVNNYQTKYFHVCPGASNLYKDIESKGVDMDMAERSARLQDVLYFVEEHIQRDGYKPERDYVMVANNLAVNIMKLAKMMGLEKEHSYIQGHVDTIEKVVKEKGLQERISELTEDNVPTDPSKWSYYKSQAKKKFDVYPSAYANAWAAKQYKDAGGGWRTKKESVSEGRYGTFDNKEAKIVDKALDKAFKKFETSLKKAHDDFQKAVKQYTYKGSKADIGGKSGFQDTEGRAAIDYFAEKVIKSTLGVDKFGSYRTGWMTESAVKEAAERDYKKEYEKYGKSEKAKKYRAELNKYNREKGTYGNGDGKDASHKGGKIAGFEDESKNRGRREKSRLKKESTLNRENVAEGVMSELDLMAKEAKDFKDFLKDVFSVPAYRKHKGKKDIMDFLSKFYKDARNESINEEYYKQASEAADAARKYAEKKGYEIDEDDWQSKIAAGGKYGRLRPGKEKTHTFSIRLLKNGKPQRKMLQVSLYGMPSGKYELTTYIN